MCVVSWRVSCHRACAVISGKGKEEESAKQREGDGRSAKAEEGTEDGESEPRDAFYLLHEKSKRFLQELKASDNHTLSLLSNFHL